MRRHHLIAAVCFTILVLSWVARTTLKRNVVEGLDGQPLVGAYIAVLTDSRGLYHVRSDARGRFRIPEVSIFDETAGRMVICAEGYLPFLTEPSNTWSATWRLQAGSRGIGDSLEERGWTGPTPPECGDQTPSDVLWAGRQQALRMREKKACMRRAAEHAGKPPLAPRPRT